MGFVYHTKISGHVNPLPQGQKYHTPASSRAAQHGVAFKRADDDALIAGARLGIVAQSSEPAAGPVESASAQGANPGTAGNPCVTSPVGLPPASSQVSEAFFDRQAETFSQIPSCLREPIAAALAGMAEARR